MAALSHMPGIAILPTELLPFGQRWREKESLPRTPPNSSGQLGNLFDRHVGQALATLVGGVDVILPNMNAILPVRPDVVEVGPVRIVGGIRPQNFDVGYRPDGVRFAFDSKTLNDLKSVSKNYQNMINDLGTEATTVHTRFPYAVIAFMVIVPAPCLVNPQRSALTRTLERLTGRIGPLDSPHKAEAISLIVWRPDTGEIDPSWPEAASPLRIEGFSQQVEQHYVGRYKGLPPHDVDEPAVEAEGAAIQESSEST